MEFLKEHWKVFLPVTVTIILFLFMYFKPQTIFPPKKPNLVISEKLIFKPLPIHMENKAPFENKRSNEIVNPGDKNGAKVEMEYDSTGTKVRFRVITKTDNIFIKPQFDLLMKIANLGGESGQIIGVSIGSDSKKSTYLRDLLYKPELNINRNPPSKDSSLTTIVPKDTVDYLYPELSLDFPQNKKDSTFLMHILIIYTDGNGTIYDTYYWYTYKDLNPNVDSLFDFQKTPIFQKTSDSNLVIKLPTRPKEVNYNIDDFIVFVDKEFLPSYMLNEKESEVFESLRQKKSK